MSSGVSSVGSIGGKPVSGVPAADDVSCQGSGLRDSGSSEDQVGDSPYGFQEGMGEEIFSARERQSAALLPPLSPFASGTEYSDLSSSATTRKHGGSEQKGGAGASAGQGDAGADAQTTTSGGAGGTAPAQSGGTTGTGAGGAGGGGDDRPPQKPAPSDDRPEPSPKRRKLAGEDSDKGGAGVAQHVPGDNGTPVSSDDEDEEDDEGPADGAGGSGALQGGGGPPAKGATTAPVAAGTAQETLATVARDSGHGPSTGPATVARDSGHGPSAGPADAARETQAGSSGPDDDSGSSEQWLEDIKRAVTHPSEMVHVIDFKGGRFRHLLYDPAKTVYVELQTWEAAVPTDVSRRAEQLDRVTADQARGAPSAPGVDARSSGPRGAARGRALGRPPRCRRRRRSSRVRSPRRKARAPVRTRARALALRRW
ncbi:unnamed protein product [Pedinophyceae sp. YPF-701]|nr:unnamed protein product [Pedinophyceae sp. YPF-701]